MFASLFPSRKAHLLIPLPLSRDHEKIEAIKKGGKNQRMEMYPVIFQGFPVYGANSFGLVWVGN